MAAGISEDIIAFNQSYTGEDKKICQVLATEMTKHLPEAESKIWHRHPVWFLEGNPVAGYVKEKKGIRLMFWSGADFEEENLNVKGKNFKDASIFYQTIDEIDLADLKRWIEKSRTIQWDYKNLVRRKGQLVRLN